MALLIVAGTTVPVAPDSVTRRIVLIGDQDRAYDGTLLSTKSGFKYEWDVLTAPAAVATINTIEASLESNAELACSGDEMDGTVNCYAEGDWRRRTISSPSEVDGRRLILEFTLRQV